MTGTSCDAIDISFISIDKSIELKFFHSAKIPKKSKQKSKTLLLVTK